METFYAFELTSYILYYIKLKEWIRFIGYSGNINVLGNKTFQKAVENYSTYPLNLVSKDFIERDSLHLNKFELINFIFKN